MTDSDDSSLDPAAKARAEAANDKLRRFLDADRPLPPLSDGDAVPSIPGYTGLREIARGGMGVVYESRHVPTNRIVALKVILGGAHAGSVETTRFLAEAQAVAAVDHPHVVRVYDSGSAGGCPFLSMEFLSGGTLAAKLQAGPLPVADTVAILVAVARGVEAANARQIIHRDLKPGNILFDAAGTAKVADFGLAKRGDGQTLTLSNAIFGTPEYMAPEQARGEGKFVGPEADVWALGVVLYECLTGHKPFRGENDLATLRLVSGEEPAKPRSVSRSVPADLELIALKCLEKRPADRYADAGALADDLERWQRHEPVSVKPLSSVRRLAKWTRRNKTAAAIIALMFATLTGFLLFGVQFKLRWDTEQAALQKERDDLRERDRQSLLTRSQLAAGSGRHAELIQALDEMEERGFLLSDDHRLARIESLSTVNLQERSDRELRQIDGGLLQNPELARWLLLTGESLLGEDDAKARTAIQKALEIPDGLKGPARSYAEGLIAADGESALRHFEKAYLSVPPILTAYRYACLTLFCLGRHAEIMKVCHDGLLSFPKDPPLLFIEATVGALCGRSEITSANIAVLKEMNYPVDFLKTIVTCGELASLDYGYRRSNDKLKELTFFFIGLAPRLDALQRKWNPANERTALNRVSLRVPLFVRPVLEFWKSRFDIPLLIKQILPPLTDTQYSQLGELCKIYPEGMLNYHYAEAFSNRKVDLLIGGASTRDQWLAMRPEALKAAELYQQAAHAPGHFINFRKISTDNAIMYFLLAGMDAPKYGVPSDPKVIERGMKLVLERLYSTDWETCPPFAGSEHFHARILLLGGKHSLAKEIIDPVVKREPKSGDAWMIKALIDIELGSFVSAWEACDFAEQYKANDLGGKLPSIRERCRAGLEDMKRKLQPKNQPLPTVGR